jgi:hypothetical protein
MGFCAFPEGASVCWPETKEVQYASMAPLTGSCTTALPETAKSNVFIQLLTDIRQASETNSHFQFSLQSLASDINFHVVRAQRAPTSVHRVVPRRRFLNTPIFSFDGNPSFCFDPLRSSYPLPPTRLADRLRSHGGGNSGYRSNIVECGR